MSTGAIFAVIFITALALSTALTPAAMWLGQRVGAVTRPGGRRTSEADERGVSRLGGLPIFVAFTAVALLAQFMPVERLDPEEVIRLTGLLLGGAVIYGVGLLDDLFDLPPWALFLAQGAAAGVAIYHIIIIEYFNNPLTGQQTPEWPYIFTFILSLLWIVGMTNTVNFLDGSDGLAAGVVIIAAGMLFVNSAFEIVPAQISVSLLPLALMGAALGFLVFNFYPSKIILGGGAYYLGFVIGCLSIIGGAKMAAILMVMTLPILDAAWQAAHRFLHSRSPFKGDRGHIHLRLVDMGVDQRLIAAGYYAFCLAFGSMTLLLESRLYKLVSLFVLIVVVVAGFILITRVQPPTSVPTDEHTD